MNQVKSYIQLTKSIASKLQSIKRVNTLSKLSDNEYLTQVIVSKKNIVENSSLDYQNLYKVSDKGFQLIHQGSIVQSNLFTSYSHDQNRFVKQQALTEEAEKPRQVIEVYESNKLLFSINTQKYHEEILNNEMVGEPFKWNSKNNKILYLAKAKAKESKTFFQIEKEEELKHAWNYRKYEQSWGERMDNIDVVNLFMLDVENQKLYKILTPPNLFLTYPQFLQNDDIIIGGYQISKEFKYGIVHCFNRRSGIYLLEKPQLIELPEKPETLEQEIQLQLLSKHDVSIKPSISPDYKKILYMGSEFKHQHLCYLSLNLINLENNQVEELVPIHNENHINKVRNNEEVRDNIFGGICGYYDDLQQTFWNKESSYFIFSSFVLGQQIIYGINVNTKQIENLSHKLKQTSTHNSLIVNYDNLNDVLYFTDQNINQSPHLCALLRVTEQNRQIIREESNLTIAKQDNFNEEFVYSGEAEGFVWYLNSPSNEIGIPKYYDKRPLIVIAHGGPHGHAFSAYTQLRHTLLEQGFILLAPNYSGSSSYGQKFIEKLSGNIGTLDVQEILDMVQQLQSKFNIGKVFILGGSYGGYLSAMMGSKYHDIFNAAVIMNPVVNLPFMINITDIPEWGSSCALNKEHTWNLSAEDYKILLEKSPMLSPLKIPSLLLIGAKDRRCPYQQSLALRAQALEANTNVQTYVYPNSDHSLADSLNTGYDTFMKTILFLNEQI